MANGISGPKPRGLSIVDLWAINLKTPCVLYPANEGDTPTLARSVARRPEADMGEVALPS